MPMKSLTVLLPKSYLETLQKLVDAGYYPSLSAAVRTSVRELLRREEHLLKRT